MAACRSPALGAAACRGEPDVTERILIYAAVDPTDLGGVQRVCERLGGCLREQGHVVRVAWPRPNPRAPADAVYALPALVWRGRLPAPRSLCAATIALVRLAHALLRFRPTVVNVHFITASARYFVILRRLFRYRLVVSAHGSDVLRPQDCDVSHLPALLRQADAVTAVSAVTQARIEERLGTSHRLVHVIPNGIDLKFWEAARHPGNAERDRATVLSVGRLDPVKGHDVLIRAFARVRSHVPAARLIIAGAGGFRPRLDALVDEQRLQDGAVIFTGAVPSSEVRNWLARACVFALPSRSEGLPLALLEAMAAGVPTIATRVGGIPEVIVPGTGLLVAPEDPEALAHGIVQLLQDRALRERVRATAAMRAASFDAAAADSAYAAVLHVAATNGRPVDRLPYASEETAER